MQETQNTASSPSSPSSLIVSRTIRITESGEYKVSTNHSFAQADKGSRFLSFTTLDDASIAFNELKEANMRPSYLTYSLFIKSQEELTDEFVRTYITKLLPNVNITYIRINNNKHTGKVVVDFLTDYQTIKSSSTDDLRFFHFDPTRVRTGGFVQGSGAASGSFTPRAGANQGQGSGPRARANQGQGSGPRARANQGPSSGPRTFTPRTDGASRGSGPRTFTPRAGKGSSPRTFTPRTFTPRTDPDRGSNTSQVNTSSI